MKYTTKTEYGLICLLYMARKEGREPITIRELASAERYSQAYVEKILQGLRQAGIVQAQHGNQGGYVLARTPDRITLREVIEALEGATFEVFCAPGTREQIVCTHYCGCGASPAWLGAKKVLDEYFESVTLDRLMRTRPEPAARA